MEPVTTGPAGKEAPLPTTTPAQVVVSPQNPHVLAQLFSMKFLKKEQYPATTNRAQLSRLSQQSFLSGILRFGQVPHDLC